MRAEAATQLTEQTDGANALLLQIARVSQDFADAREKHELALGQVEKFVKDMRRNAASTRFYTERNLPAAAADAASLAERCMLLHDALEDLTVIAKAAGLNVPGS